MTNFLLLTLVAVGVAAATLMTLAALRAAQGRRREERLLATLQRSHLAGLHDLEPQAFHTCVMCLLRRNGCAPKRLRGYRRLLLARTGRGETLVQWRFWTAAVLGDNELRQLERAMRRRGLRRGMLLTAGDIADGLGARAARAGIDLVDGRAIVRRLLGDSYRGR
ncbi:MAG: restriction endonuclease [Pseudomonadota bacterium]